MVPLNDSRVTALFVQAVHLSSYLSDLVLELLARTLDDIVADTNPLLAREVEALLHHRHPRLERPAVIDERHPLSEDHVSHILMEGHRVAVELIRAVILQTLGNLLVELLLKLCHRGVSVLLRHLDIENHHLVTVGWDDVVDARDDETLSLLVEFYLIVSSTHGEKLVHVSLVGDHLRILVICERELASSELAALEMRRKLLSLDDELLAELESLHAEIPDCILVVLWVLVGAANPNPVVVVVKMIAQPAAHVAYGELRRRIDVLEVERKREYLVWMEVRHEDAVLEMTLDVLVSHRILHWVKAETLVHDAAAHHAVVLRHVPCRTERIESCVVTVRAAGH